MHLLRNHLKDYTVTIKNFLTCSIGSILLRGITAITSLLTLRIFTPAEFGLLSLINQFMLIFPIFLNLGLRQAFWMEYFHIDSQERRRLVNRIIIIYLCIAIPLAFLGLFHISGLNKLIFFGQATNTMIIIALFYSFIQFFSELYLQVLRNQMNALSLTIVQISAALITIFINLILVFYLKLGIIGVILANTASILFIALLGFYHYLKCNSHCYITTKKITSQAKYLLILGFPFIPNILFSWILSSGDRWVLAYLTDMNQVGIYALADMAGQLFNMCILYPMNASYIPYMLNKYKQNQILIPEIEKQNRKNMWWSMGIMSIFITVGTFIAFIIGPKILPPKYLPSLNYIWILLMGYVFFMGTYFSSCILVFKRRTWQILGMNIIAATTNIILNFLLIPTFNIYGCTVATLASYAIFFYLNLREANRVTK